MVLGTLRFPLCFLDVTRKGPRGDGVFSCLAERQRKGALMMCEQIEWES